MKSEVKPRFPHLENILKTSLFSQVTLTDNFSDKKALAFIEACKGYVDANQSEVQSLIKNLLLESIARNIGAGENYGSGFPYDYLEKLNHKLSTEIDEGLLCDILEWGYNMTDLEMVTISKNNLDEYFFQNKKEPRELISYETICVISQRAFESQFYLEYERLTNIILCNIPAKAWITVIAKEETIEKYL